MLPVEEEKCLLLYDRATDGYHRTPHVLDAGARQPACSVAIGVHPGTAREIEAAAVKFIRPRLCHHADDSAAIASILGGIAVVQQLEFLNAFDRWP